MWKNLFGESKFNKFLTFWVVFCECDRPARRFDKKITKKNLHILKHSVTFTPYNNEIVRAERLTHKESSHNLGL